MNRAGLKRLGSVDEHQLAVVLSLDLDLAFARDGDPVARVRIDAVHPHPAAGHEIQVPLGRRIDRDRFARFDGRAEHLGVGVDGQRAVLRVAAGEQLEGAFARIPRKRLGAPARLSRRRQQDWSAVPRNPKYCRDTYRDRRSCKPTGYHALVRAQPNQR